MTNPTPGSTWQEMIDKYRQPSYTAYIPEEPVTQRFDPLKVGAWVVWHSNDTLAAGPDLPTVIETILSRPKPPKPEHCRVKYYYAEGGGGEMPIKEQQVLTERKWSITRGAETMRNRKDTIWSAMFKDKGKNIPPLEKHHGQLETLLQWVRSHLEQHAGSGRLDEHDHDLVEIQGFFQDGTRGALKPEDFLERVDVNRWKTPDEFRSWLEEHRLLNAVGDPV